MSRVPPIRAAVLLEMFLNPAWAPPAERYCEIWMEIRAAAAGVLPAYSTRR